MGVGGLDIRNLDINVSKKRVLWFILAILKFTSVFWAGGWKKVSTAEKGICIWTPTCDLLSKKKKKSRVICLEWKTWLTLIGSVTILVAWSYWRQLIFPSFTFLYLFYLVPWRLFCDCLYCTANPGVCRIYQSIPSINTVTEEIYIW